MFDSFTTAGGCDSIITTNLQVTPFILVNQDLSICDGDSVFVGGTFQTSAGTYVDTLTGSNGCDSILTTNLTVFPNSYSSRDIRICRGDSVLAGGQYQTTSGI